TLTVQVENRPEKLGRRTDVSFPIHADVKALCDAVTPLLKQHDDKFLKAAVKRHAKIMKAPVGSYTRNVEHMKPIHPEYVAHVL
ncbi:ubiquinone-dependent pyruvate dehydrogenase, partial [Pseudomonas sp. MPR-R2A4]